MMLRVVRCSDSVGDALFLRMLNQFLGDDVVPPYLPSAPFPLLPCYTYIPLTVHFDHVSIPKP